MHIRKSDVLSLCLLYVYFTIQNQMEVMCPFWQNNYLVTSKFLWQRSMQGQYLPHLARGRKHPVLEIWVI